MKKIALLNMNTAWLKHKEWIDFPYGLCLLKAALRDKYTVRIIDANGSRSSETEALRDCAVFAPDVIGISIMSMEYKDVLVHIVALLKQEFPHVPIVVGGIYATLLPEFIAGIPGIDYVVSGEGEYRLPLLLEALFTGSIALERIDGLAYRLQNGEIVLQKIENYIENLDALPLPDYSDIDFAMYSHHSSAFAFYTNPRNTPCARIISSRGCPFRCIFCSSKAINGDKIRYHSARYVLNEIDCLVKEYKVKEIFFYDDNFLLDRNRVEHILHGIIERNYDLIWKPAAAVAAYALDDDLLELMWKSKCYQLPLAIESGNSQTLKYIRKPLSLEKVVAVVAKAKAIGFELSGSFIFGLPNETWDMILDTFAFAESLGLDMCSFNIAAPLPKTELYDICAKNNLLVEHFDFDSGHFNGFGCANIQTSAFSRAELVILRAFEWDRICFSTPEKRQKAARIVGCSLKELAAWRKKTRNQAIQTVQSFA